MNNRTDRRGQQTCSKNGLTCDQEGIALLTVMLLLLIMTVLGIASITITGLENRMSGFLRAGESVAAASESCIGVGVNLVRQTIASPDPTVIPAAFLGNAVPPGPVPVTNAVMLHSEIFGMDTGMNDMTNNADAAAAAPNLAMTVGGLAVSGDIDRLYSKASTAVGTTSAGQGYTVVYRINCVATNVATGTAGAATAVYMCSVLPGAFDCSKLIM
jgi:Tfp pilus assembly protein PilX